MRVVFLWRPLKSCQGGDSESGDLSWEDLLEKHKDLSDCELDSCAHVRVVLVVIDVFVSLSLVVMTEFCEVFRVALIGKMLYRSPFLSPKSVHIVVQIRRKR